MPLTLLANPKQLPDPQVARLRPPGTALVSRVTPAGRCMSGVGAGCSGRTAGIDRKSVV